MVKRVSMLFFGIVLCQILFAQTIYDPTINPEMELNTILQQTISNEKEIILIFGSDWCHACENLNDQLQSDDILEKLHSNFEVLKIDVGHFDNNQTFAEKYDIDIRKGIPQAAILTSRGNLIQGGLFYSKLLEYIESGNL